MQKCDWQLSDLYKTEKFLLKHCSFMIDQLGEKPYEIRQGRDGLFAIFVETPAPNIKSKDFRSHAPRHVETKRKEPPKKELVYVA
jgi:hypothetical protein